MLEILKELAAGRPVNRVKEHSLFVEQHIAVVGNTPWDGMDVFKESQAMVVGSDPEQIVCNVSYTIYSITSSYASIN
jgi:hypothetical protein